MVHVALVNACESTRVAHNYPPRLRALITSSAQLNQTRKINRYLTGKIQLSYNAFLSKYLCRSTFTAAHLDTVERLRKCSVKRFPRRLHYSFHDGLEKYTRYREHAPWIPTAYPCFAATNRMTLLSYTHWQFVSADLPSTTVARSSRTTAIYRRSSNFFNPQDRKSLALHVRDF